MENMVNTEIKRSVTDDLKKKKEKVGHDPCGNNLEIQPGYEGKLGNCFIYQNVIVFIFLLDHFVVPL